MQWKDIKDWVQTFTYIFVGIVFAIALGVLFSSLILTVGIVVGILYAEFGNTTIKADKHAVWQAQRANFGWYVVFLGGAIVLGALVYSLGKTMVELGRSLASIQITGTLPSNDVLFAIGLTVFALLALRALYVLSKRLRKPNEEAAQKEEQIPEKKLVFDIETEGDPTTNTNGKPHNVYANVQRQTGPVPSFQDTQYVPESDLFGQQKPKGTSQE